MRWEDRPVHTQALREVEEQLRLEPDSPSLLFRRALLLDELNDVDAAKNAYIAVLRRDENHFGAMNNLGTLLCRLGHSVLGMRIYAETVQRYPNEALPRINFANALAQAGDHASARDQYEAAIAVGPGNRVAHQGLGNVLSALGDEERARIHWKAAFDGNPVNISPYYGDKPPIRTIVLYSQTDGNIPLDDILDDRVFQRMKLTVEYFDNARNLPPHDVIFNAVSDVDRCATAVEAALRVVERAATPIINHPSGILRTGREQIARRLSGLSGVVTAATKRFARADLAGADAVQILECSGLTFPLLLRAPGFHTGQHFVKVDQPGQLPYALSELPGDELFAMRYLDTRSPDGNYRKYRVMFIGGELYPLHLAISPQWKVHYFTADMASDGEYREEEAAFLHDMRGALGDSAIDALERIERALRLDYGGIDFALDASGNIAVFEANATMRVAPVPADPCWNYRRQPVKRIFDAVASMLARLTTDKRAALS